MIYQGDHMSIFFSKLLVGIALSMDAFSLAIFYGTMPLTRTKQYQLSVCVGIFHFFMPLFGYILGDFFLAQFILYPKIFVGLIFLVIAIQMLISLKKDEEIMSLTSLFALIVFAFTVSIDSFSIGLAFGTYDRHLFLSSSIFSIVSATFTYFGLSIGKVFSNHFGKVASFIGSIILLLLALDYLFF